MPPKYVDWTYIVKQSYMYRAAELVCMRDKAVLGHYCRMLPQFYSQTVCCCRPTVIVWVCTMFQKKKKLGARQVVTLTWLGDLLLQVARVMRC